MNSMLVVKFYRVLPLILCFHLASCGGTANFNKVFGGDDGAGDTRLIAAQSAFDAGNFATAEKYAKELVAANPYNERASILLGFTHLSMGGVDPFILARQLINLTKSTSSTSSTPATGNASALAGDLELAALPTTTTTSTTASGSLSSGVSSVLVKLQSLVPISESEEKKLFLKLFSASDISPAPAQLNLFGASNQLYIPNEVDATLRANIEVLNYFDLALADVCRFVDADIITAQAQRGASTTCTPTSTSRKYSEQAHFLWAFSHLAEAVTFQRALLYVSGENTQPSIDVASSKLSTQTSTSSASDIQTLVANVAEVSTAVGKVFDVTDQKSMILATIADLEGVTLGFGKIANMPASIQKGITGAFSDLTALSKTASGGATAVNNAKTLKSQITTSLAKVVSTKIQSAATGNTATTTQIANLCTGFDKLIADAPTGGSLAQTKPAACSQ